MWRKVPLAVDLDPLAPRARCDQVSRLVGRENAVRNLGRNQMMASDDRARHSSRPCATESAPYLLLLGKHYLVGLGDVHLLLG
jgi:hypothetical protein